MLELVAGYEAGQGQVVVLVLVLVRLPPVLVLHAHDLQNFPLHEIEAELAARQVRVVERVVIEQRPHVFLFVCLLLIIEKKMYDSIVMNCCNEKLPAAGPKHKLARKSPAGKV